MFQAPCKHQFTDSLRSGLQTVATRPRRIIREPKDDSHLLGSVLWTSQIIYSQNTTATKASNSSEQQHEEETHNHRRKVDKQRKHPASLIGCSSIQHKQHQKEAGRKDDKREHNSQQPCLCPRAASTPTKRNAISANFLFNQTPRDSNWETAGPHCTDLCTAAPVVGTSASGSQGHMSRISHAHQRGVSDMKRELAFAVLSVQKLRCFS